MYLTLESLEAPRSEEAWWESILLKTGLRGNEMRNWESRPGKGRGKVMTGL